MLQVATSSQGAGFKLLDREEMRQTGMLSPDELGVYNVIKEAGNTGE